MILCLFVGTGPFSLLSPGQVEPHGLQFILLVLQRRLKA